MYKNLFILGSLLTISPFIFSPFVAEAQTSSPTTKLATKKPVFKINDKTSVKVKVGDTLNYIWDIPGLTEVTSTLTSNKDDTCTPKSVRNVSTAWLATTASGSTSSKILDCQVGVTYRVKILGKITKKSGKKSSYKKSVTVKVAKAKK